MIDKFRSAFLAFAIFAITSTAIAPASAAVAKHTIQSNTRNHGIHWTPTLRMPAAQRPASDPFASMVLG
ncbi:hypothetical protein [Bradyrhizobium sp. NAS80.1]|uniref:hypothetical protein n=1 Tax=Bradyrhizobium sp. NAS80.1 TaxID=1680159 RepID=UPI001160FCA8|nr:hypothetical protein [Bradyrhizobium sp. NAS80.1]